jgi:hypothetical protein
MKKSTGFTEGREHTRAKMNNIVVGILNSKEPETIGTITDISLGGVKCVYYELRMEPNKRPVHSIDLIAGSHYVLEIPCKYVWDGEVETESNTKSTNIKQCGIQFGKLTPIQTFMLNKFIDICVSQGIKSLTSRTPIAVGGELPSYIFLKKSEETF